MSIEVIKAFRQKPIVIYPVYLKITKDYATAAALAQVLYWHEIMGGKFYKIDSDFEAELHLTSKQFRRVKTALKSLNFLHITVEQNRPKTFYDVDYKSLSSFIKSILKKEESPVQKGQFKPAQKGQFKPAQKGQFKPAQKGQFIYTENTTEQTTEITNNNVNFENSIAKCLLLLPFLSEKDKNKAIHDLTPLTDNERDYAILLFNKKVNSGKPMTNPMGYLVWCIEEAVKGVIQDSPLIQTPTIEPTSEPPKDITAIVRKHVENHRNIKALRDELKRNNCILIVGHGVVYGDEIRKAGLLELFDEPAIDVLKIAFNDKKDKSLSHAKTRLGMSNKRKQDANNEGVLHEADLFNVQPNARESKMKELYNSELYKTVLEMAANDQTNTPEYQQMKAECDKRRNAIMSVV